MAVSFPDDVGGVATFVEVLVVEIELPRRGEVGTGVLSIRGEPGFFPFDFEGPAGAGWLSISKRGLDTGMTETECSEEKDMGL